MGGAWAVGRKAAQAVGGVDCGVDCGLWGQGEGAGHGVCGLDYDRATSVLSRRSRVRSEEGSGVRREASRGTQHGCVTSSHVARSTCRLSRNGREPTGGRAVTPREPTAV